MKVDERRKRLLQRTCIDFQQMSAVVEDPLIFDKADGVYYYDIEGRRYFDAIGGVFVATLGHGHPRVLEAMRNQMARMTFAPPLHGIADVTLDFIETLGSVTPGRLKFVKPFSGGSEAIEAAIKFARQYFKQTGRPGKYKFISRYHGYHGSTGAAMSASGTGARKTKFEPHMAGFLKVFPPTHYRTQFPSWEECNRFAAQSVEEVIVAEDPDTVAGVIIEPIGNTGGIITPTPEYFQILRRICDRYNVMLIFDEVITFAKTGSMFAAQTFDVTPDLLCCGKGLSNGAVPVAAMVAREDLADAFWGEPGADLQFMHGNTFAGNPLACAAGKAVLEEIVENRLDERGTVVGDHVAERLAGLKKHGFVREVRGRGVLRGVELVKDHATLEPFPALGNALKRTAIQNRLIMRVDPSWFAVAPALTIAEAEIDEMCTLIERAFVQAIEIARGATEPEGAVTATR